MDRAVRAGHSERSIARCGDAVASAAGVAATPTLPSPTLQRHFSYRRDCCSAATRWWRLVAGGGVGEGLLEEANLGVKQRFAVRAPYARPGNPVNDGAV